MFPDALEEIKLAVREELEGRGDSKSVRRDARPLTGLDWVAAPAAGLALKVVARATNRVFIGLPLCAFIDTFGLRCPRAPQLG